MCNLINDADARHLPGTFSYKKMQVADAPHENINHKTARFPYLDLVAEWNEFFCGNEPVPACVVHVVMRGDNSAYKHITAIAIR